MSKQISDHAAAAKMIRAELKKNGIAATVRARSYSGGSSVDVTITEDVLPATKHAVEEFCSRFQQGHFDGMTDSYDYSNRRDDLPQVRFVFVRVDYSDELRTAAREYVAAINGIDEWQRDQYVNLVIAGRWDDGEFWLSRKPRQRAS